MAALRFQTGEGGWKGAGRRWGGGGASRCEEPQGLPSLSTRTPDLAVALAGSHQRTGDSVLLPVRLATRFFVLQSSSVSTPQHKAHVLLPPPSPALSAALSKPGWWNSTVLSKPGSWNSTVLSTVLSKPAVGGIERSFQQSCPNQVGGIQQPFQQSCPNQVGGIQQPFQQSCPNQVGGIEQPFQQSCPNQRLVEFNSPFNSPVQTRLVEFNSPFNSPVQTSGWWNSRTCIYSYDQVRVSVGDGCLCCVLVTFFDR